MCKLCRLLDSQRQKASTSTEMFGVSSAHPTPTSPTSCWRDEITWRVKKNQMERPISDMAVEQRIEVVREGEENWAPHTTLRMLLTSSLGTSCLPACGPEVWTLRFSSSHTTSLLECRIRNEQGHRMKAYDFNFCVYKCRNFSRCHKLI